MEPKEIEKVYYWEEIRYSELMVTPDMLSNAGVVVRCNTRLKGEGNKNTQAQPRNVRFDKHYVGYSLRKKFKRIADEQLRTFLEDFIRRELP